MVFKILGKFYLNDYWVKEEKKNIKKFKNLMMVCLFLKYFLNMRFDRFGYFLIGKKKGGRWEVFCLWWILVRVFIIVLISEVEYFDYV